MESNKLEIACFNLKSAIIANKAGANRIELCKNYKAGGLTPTNKTIIDARKKIKIDIYVIIRPREGNFNYSDTEIKTMKKSILFCKKNKINGVVFGCLTKKNVIDEKKCKELILLASPMKITFHRAIDKCEKINHEIKKLIKLNFDHILTSGGKKNAIKGILMLKKIQKKYKNKISIIAGGQIRSNNISEILKTTKCNNFHSSAILKNNTLCDKYEIENLKKIINN